jgi:hypothetical protein
MLRADPELLWRLYRLFKPRNELIARRDKVRIRNVASHCPTFTCANACRHRIEARQQAAA